MRKLALLAALFAAPAYAASPIVGPLDARNNLGEIATSGSAAQAAARVNLGNVPAISGTPTAGHAATFLDATHVQDGGTLVNSVNGNAGAITAAQIAAALSGQTLSGALHAGANTLDGSALAFTGGSLNGVAIGGATPSTGAFTMLSATGAATLSGGGTLGNQLLINVPTTLSGSGSTYVPIWQNQVFSGSVSNAYALSAFFQTWDKVAAGTAQLNGLLVKDIGNGNTLTGNRSAGMFEFDLDVTSGNTASMSYVGATTKCAVNVNDGGVSGVGNARGACFGGNSVASATAGATYLSALNSWEFDTYVDLTASVQDKIGVGIVDTGNNTPTGGKQAYRDDQAVSINNQYAPGSSRGWAVGIGFGRYGGNFPIATNGTMISGEGIGGTTFTVANGIDWHLGTFTGNSWNDGHIALTGAGHIASTGTAPALSACGTSPAISGTDTKGAVTVGTGTTTACTITFATAYASAPVCVISDDQVNIRGDIGAVSATALTVNFQSAMDGHHFYYHCLG